MRKVLFILAMEFCVCCAHKQPVEDKELPVRRPCPRGYVVPKDMVEALYLIEKCPNYRHYSGSRYR